MTVHLELTVSGTKIDGYSSQTSLGREDTIECLSYEDGTTATYDKGTGQMNGKRVHTPITIDKRICKASPMIAQAICQNSAVDAVFKFYQPDPTGDGTIQHFYTVEITKGRIVAIKTNSPDTLDPGSSERPPTETVSFVFHNKRWVHEIASLEHEDDWAARE